MTLTQRIEARRKLVPVPVLPEKREPVAMWRRLGTPKDLTGSVLVNGAWQRPEDGGAA